MSKVTCEQALADARAALDDDSRAQPAPWTEHHRDAGNIIDANGFHICRTVALQDGRDHECEVICARSTREPRLAEWVRGVLEARFPNYEPRFDTTHDGLVLVRYSGPVTPSGARALAAALLRAADLAEAK